MKFNFLMFMIIKLILIIVLNSLFETTQTLFWAVFGLVDLESFELDGIKIFTRFWGMLMFGAYSVINVVVLLNLLIAMMNHSYQSIAVSFLSKIINFNQDCVLNFVNYLNSLLVLFNRSGQTLNGNSHEANCGSVTLKKVEQLRHPSTLFLR